MQVGELFDGRYRIMRILGQGGMSRVYLAQNVNTGTLWAIKEIPGGKPCGMELPAEPKFLKRLEHPALPRLFDILEQDGNLYMVSDYIDGISLDKKLEAEGRIAEDTVIDWAIQLCGALDYLHTLEPHPIIYRDMKPSNIILAGNGALKLIDFGIAREYKPLSGNDTVFIGTRGYAAPEQYGTGQTSAASDIYSLGITLHHLLTGKNPLDPPYGTRPARQFDETVSPGMETILLKCTKEDASERYQSAALLKRDFEALASVRNNVNNKDTDDRKGEFPDSINQTAQPDSDLWEKRSKPVAGITQQASIRRMVVTVWGNAEFGCELAYMAAKHTKGKVFLADLDLLAPKADLFLNLKKVPDKLAQTGIYGRSGLDLVADAMGKGLMDEELLLQATAKRKDLKNLYVLTGNYRLENYEYYKEDWVPKLIEKCYRCFDITILLVNKSIYDAFTLAALLGSDMNIAAFRGDVDELREFNSYVEFLKGMQRLSAHRTKFVLFQYDKATCIPLDEARNAVQGNLLGLVPYSRRRLLHRNLNGAYSCRMEKVIEQEYIRLLTKMELIPESGMLRRLRHGRAQLGNRTGTM
jgi:serine/threonine protein kinase